MPRNLLLLLGVLLPAALPPPAPRPATLLVRTPAGWQEWWRSDRAPERWAGSHPVVAGAVRWRPVAPGVEWGELTLAGAGEAWRIGVVLARLEPDSVRLETRLAAPADGGPGTWTIDSAPAAAVVALNAGQFTRHGPWGWLVRHGVERRPPGAGPLAPALVVDTGGGVRLVPPDSIAELRGDPAVREAFQSYPAVLVGDGEIPRPVRAPGLGVDLRHRDARLALGLLRDGRLLIALTRFEGLGGVLSNLPFGLTTPEIAAVAGALGCERAVLLDGGISSQLLLRAAGGDLAWPGLRAVPLGLVVLSNRPGPTTE